MCTENDKFDYLLPQVLISILGYTAAANANLSIRINCPLWYPEDMTRNTSYFATANTGLLTRNSE